MVVAVLACGPATPPPEAPPAPSASATAALPPAEAPDPAVVRCGVDDQPRAIGQLSPPDFSPLDSPLDRRPLLGKIMPPEPPPPPNRGAPIQLPPSREVSVQQGTPRLGKAGLSSAAGLPASFALVGLTDLDVCEPLAAAPDSGPLDLEVELASNALPLRVRASRSKQSPFVRCLMERACRVRAPVEGASQRLTLPLMLRVEAPPPPPPPPPPRPISRLEVAPVKGKENDMLHEQIASLVTSLGAGCLSSQPLLSGKLRIRLEFVGQGGSVQPDIDFLGAPPMRRRPPLEPRLRVTKVVTEGKMEPAMAGLMACLAGQLSSRTVGVGDGSSGKQTRIVRVDLQAFLP
jgi:hypothetical protein